MMRDDYAKIRTWFQQNTHKLKPEEAYDKASLDLIAALPAPEDATELEIVAVAWEVISGYGEWAFVESDGEMKMSEYAKRILNFDGARRDLDDAEMDALKDSTLYPLMFIAERRG